MSCMSPVGHDWPPTSSPSSVWSVQGPGRKTRSGVQNIWGQGGEHVMTAQHSEAVALAPLAGFELVSEALRGEVFQSAVLASF